MGNSEEDSSDSRSHSRSGEHESRLSESAFYRSDGMAVEPTDNLQNIATTFPARSNLFANRLPWKKLKVFAIPPFNLISAVV